MAYVPTSDVLERHEYGITKHRKTASTGGGRAWSEDEEVYLLQTRLQKMPYKHIASHLKKTELACRLHYHQLSHGSNRRKRTTSMSSGSSAGHSPIMPMAVAPSPIMEASAPVSRDITPPGSAGGYDDSCDAPSDPHTTHHHYHHHQQQAIQLPSIMGPRASGTSSSSSHLPAILPKLSTCMQPSGAAVPMSAPASSSSGYPPTPLAENGNNNNHYRNLAPSPFPQQSSSATAPSASGPVHLRLDCSLPAPATPAHVDMARLQAIYAQHRTSFWSVIAAEYGAGVSPIVLEQAWKTSMGVGGNHTPITPVTSPNDRDTSIMNPYEKNSSSNNDKTRISAILGIDANPRSPKEREMVRRLEEGRSSVGVVASA